MMPHGRSPISKHRRPWFLLSRFRFIREGRRPILVACNIHIGTGVETKRHRVLGVGEEEKLPHCDEPTTTKTRPFRLNPPGRWGLPAILSSFVVVMDEDQPPPHSSTLLGKTHRRSYRYQWDRAIASIVGLRNHRPDISAGCERITPALRPGRRL